ncbi:kinesin-like protein KIFC3 isoform X2 [Hydra vulgaris]|nr:kinesin-like protein KIFC3 isoform X2 [Hydra vulgaris]
MFNSPSKYAPNENQFPDKEEKQKKVLGFLEVKEEFLQKEPEETDKQNLLLKKQKVLEDTILHYESNLMNDEVKRRIKTIKKTYECQLEDKRKLIRELQHLVNVLETDMKEIINKKESTEVVFNISDLVKRFSMEVNDLSISKSKLIATVSNLENKVEMQKKEIDDLNNIIRNEYVAKEDYEFLQSEKYLFFQNLESYKKIAGDSLIQVNNIKKQMKELQEQFVNKEQEYSVQMLSLKNENRLLKKKFHEVEEKYMLMAFTPAKIRTVVDEETEQKIIKMRSEKLRLEEEKHNLKKLHRRELTLLTTELEILNVKNVKLETEIIKKDEEIQKVIQQMKQQEISFKEDAIKQVNEKTVTQEKKIQALILFHDTFFKKLKDLSNELHTIKEEKEAISGQIVFFINFIKSSLINVKAMFLNEVKETDRRSQILVKQYAKEIEVRKHLHNQLIELRGNIRVFCRVRPVIKEDGDNSKNVITFDSDDSSIIKVEHKLVKRLFKMDKVFNGSTSQAEIFSDVESLVTSCLDGYNVCIFAYGQTGSGKTYTMEGTLSDPGINQQALSLLFKECKEKIDWKYSICVSYMEIYNEMIRDLLCSCPTEKLEVKQSKEGTYVPGLTSIEVENVYNVNELFNLGKRNRITAATDMNAHSSRSHSVLVINVSGTNKNANIKVSGKLNLVDLAGSERLSKSGSEGIRMKETQSINASLSSLSNVIHSLKNKCTHIPYRNSKLTYLLQDSLGGDSKTLMVVQVSPVEKNSGETVLSLSFAERIRDVELGLASKKIVKT